MKDEGFGIYRIWTLKMEFFLTLDCSFCSEKCTKPPFIALKSQDIITIVPLTLFDSKVMLLYPTIFSFKTFQINSPQHYPYLEAGHKIPEKKERKSQNGYKFNSHAITCIENDTFLKTRMTLGSTTNHFHYTVRS